MKDWEKYEKDVFDLCQSHFEGGTVTKNEKQRGRYSNRSRQIDVQVKYQFGDSSNTTIIDCKRYSSPINVKNVEEFIGMLDDLGADKGIMIAPNGYTKSALERAANAPTHLELDICTFEELQKFQGLVAFPYTDNNSVFIEAPFGCVIDAKKDDRIGAICTIYRRGFILDDAFTEKEFAYVNFWKKDDDIQSLDKLLEYQQKYMESHYQSPNINLSESLPCRGIQAKIRIAEFKENPIIELTGFVEFDNFIFFCVWLSKKVDVRRNRRKLEQLIKIATPIEISFKGG